MGEGRLPSPAPLPPPPPIEHEGDDDEDGEVHTDDVPKDSKVVVSVPFDTEADASDEYCVKIGPELPDRTHFEASADEVVDGTENEIVEKHPGLG